LWGAWTSTKADENKPIVFEKKILRRIYSPKSNEDGVYEIRTEISIIYTTNPI